MRKGRIERIEKRYRKRIGGMRKGRRERIEKRYRERIEKERKRQKVVEMTI